MSTMTQKTAEALFAIAGIQVLKIKPLPDGYGSVVVGEPPHRPGTYWWFVKTVAGWIEVGWRKRVIVIDWSDTRIRTVITEDNVTKGLDHVHAYSELDAAKYLTALAKHIQWKPALCASWAEAEIVSRLESIMADPPNACLEYQEIRAAGAQLISAISRLYEKHTSTKEEPHRGSTFAVG